MAQNRQSIFVEVIDICEVGNHSKILEKKTDLKHHELSENIELIVNVKINNHRFFYFKLRCKDLIDTPFFRYDSDGVSHRNYDDAIPLIVQQITTPHFHHFNSKGISIAYKTDKMLNENELKALEDINLCIAYFCQEGNIIPDKEDYPTITINSKELPLDFSIIDPLSNINF